VYGVLKTIQSDDKETTIKYKISIHFHPKDEENNTYVTIDIESETFINDIQPDLIAEELALACSSTLYPLVLKVDAHRLVQSICNHEEILKRWEHKKNNELTYYQGETVEAYLNLFEASLKSKRHLLGCIKNDWLFAAYFQDIYTIYGINDSKMRQTNFPIVPSAAGVQYDVKQKASQFVKDNRIKIEVKGLCSDLRTKADFKNKARFSSAITNQPTVNGKYRALYFLESETHTIQTAYVQCSLTVDAPKEITVSISKINTAT